jgi:arylsulfatase A-like enzyme
MTEPNRILGQVALTLAFLPSVLGAGQPPNFVFIIADDLGWGDVGFHGGPVPTPHLDRLAREGLELRRHYVAPVCSPTRAALLTGRYWSRFGVTAPTNARALPWATRTLPRALQEAGYATALVGKWHLGSTPAEGPNRFGFDHAYGSLAGGVGPWNHFYKKGPWSVTWHRDGTLTEEEGHVTDLLADEAVRWIDSRKSEPARPFFLYVPFTAVHLPVKEPDAWLERVPASLRARGDVPWHYAACVMHLDDAVGRIVAALEAGGHRERTLLVFTSDNGGSTASNNDSKYPADGYPEGKLPGRNHPWRGEKGTLHEGGIRVPAVAYWPGTISPGASEAPFPVVDWMPTFGALAGLGPSGDSRWDGLDRSTLLRSGSEPGLEPPLRDRALYWAGPGFRTRAVSVGSWKLIVTTGKPERLELYDLASDPGETVNLAESRPDQVSWLRERLAEAAAADRDAEPDDAPDLRR